MCGRKHENTTFPLRGSLANRRQYLVPLNRAYGENFDNLIQYKQEEQFKRILSKLTLADVRSAVQRSKVIMQRNCTNGCIEQKYKGYSYYKENPSLSIWEVVEKILKDCELI